jgi:hypothetical protein
MTVSLNSYGDKLVATGFYGSAPHAGVLRVYRSPAPGEAWEQMGSTQYGHGGYGRHDELVGDRLAMTSYNWTTSTGSVHVDSH